MRLTVFLFLMLVGSICVYAQQRLQGTVLDNKTGHAIEDASVSALNSDQAIISYVYTNKEGVFAISLNESVSFISISFMGYERMVIPAEKFNDHTVYRLESKNFKINEVRITTNRVQERKDTLIYTVSGFRMPQDRSIADVLAKMPGLEVAPSGQIKFEDKPINKLYIEGMDLMGDRYALATNNLSGKVVKEVQVLRNHQVVAALRGKSFSENAALNLVLEDAVRYTLSGSADFGTGYSFDKKSLWDARILGMILGKKQQNLSLYKTNNTGQNVSDELRKQILDLDMNQETDDPIVSLPSLSVGQMIDEQRYSMNRSHLFATNHLYKINEETTLRGQFNYLSKHNEMQEEEYSSYFYPDATVTIAEDKDVSLDVDCYAVEADYQSNGEKRFIRNRLTGNLEKNNAGNMLLTNNVPIESSQMIKKKNLTNDFTLIKTFASDRIFKLLSSNALSDLPQKIIVSPGLYEDLLNDGNSYSAFIQHARLRSFRSRTTTEFQLKVAGFYIGMEAGSGYSRQTLNSSLYCKENESLHQTQNVNFHNDLTFTDAQVYATPSFRYKDHSWNIRLSIPLSYHYYQLDGKNKNNYSRFFAEPSLLLSYELHPLWNLSNTLNYRYTVPDINNLYAGYIFTTHRQAFSGSGFYTNRSLIYSATLKFNNPLNGWFWLLGGTIIPSWCDKMFSSNQNGVLNSGEMIDRKHRNTQWNIRTRLSKNFWWWKLYAAFTGSYNETENKNLLSGVVIPYTSKSAQFAFNLSIQPCKYVSIEGSERYIHSALSSTITQGISSEYFRSNLTVNLFPSANWKLKWSNLWITGNKPVHSSVYFMDAAVSYLHKQLEIELTGNNILNRRTFQQTIYSSMTESSTLSHFRTREIVVKLMVSF